MTAVLEQSAPAAPKQQSGVISQAHQGIKAVVTRQIVTKVMGLLSTLVLARLLSPKDFGVYAIVCFSVALFGLIADAGLAVALLRQPTEPTREEESSIFWCQLLLAVIHCSLVQTFAEPVGNLYHFSSSSILLIRLLSIGSLLAVLISIPMIKLERRLDFGAQAKIEMMQSFAYNSSAIVFALLHLGAWTFALASLVGQVIAIVMLAFVSPFVPKFCFDIEVCRLKLGFGLKFQGTNILGFLKETINPVFVGLVSGATAVGFVNFAGTTAAYSLLVTTPFARLYFPIFCRVQHEPEVVAKVVETAVRWNFLIVAGFAAVALPFTDLLILKIFGAKWLPSVILIDCLLVTNMVTGLAYPLTMLSNAVNRADLPLKLSLGTSIFSWLMLPLLLPSMGINGLGLISILNTVFTVIFVHCLKKDIQLQIWKNCVKEAFIAAVATTTLLALIRLLFPQPVSYGWLGLFVLLPSGLCCYYALTNKLLKGLLQTEAKTFLASLKAKTSAGAAPATSTAETTAT
ncbi:MAG: oligosaccharide flippase family protein [Cyanobacteria bacterium SZAS-4]|nr:oligosaccharide flippase family protein [Cyanobacteria bacterium SZAS-4]